MILGKFKDIKEFREWLKPAVQPLPDVKIQQTRVCIALNTVTKFVEVFIGRGKNTHTKKQIEKVQKHYLECVKDFPELEKHSACYRIMNKKQQTMHDELLKSVKPLSDDEIISAWVTFVSYIVCDVLATAKDCIQYRNWKWLYQSIEALSRGLEKEYPKGCEVGFNVYMAESY